MSESLEKAKGTSSRNIKGLKQIKETITAAFGNKKAIESLVFLDTKRIKQT